MQTEWDVIVMGGGTAGLVAGIAAARAGAKTLIVEASGNLGGNAAVGMTFGGFFDRNRRQVVRGIPQEFVQRAVSLGGGQGHITADTGDVWISSLASVDPEIFKYLAIQMTRDAGCGVWLRSTFLGVVADDSRVSALRVVSKSGEVKIGARCIIDTTGDGDVAAAAGARFERGGGDEQQLISTMFRVSNVDTAALERFMNEVINDEGKDPWRIGHAPLRGSHHYWTPWKFEPNREEFPYAFGVYFHGNPHDIVINAVGVNADALDVESLSWAETELRKQGTELFWYLKKKVPGFNQAYLSQMYPVGVRESRRIIGDYQVTLEDILEGRTYPDVVALGAYPPDLHAGSTGAVQIDRHENLAYQLPYRAFLPTGVEGVLVAGRCMSATFRAESALRGIGPSMSTGQAVGVAAALAAKTSTLPRAVPAAQIQAALREQGAYLGD
jgi:hypothetical protein